MIYTLRHPDPKFKGQCAGILFQNGKGSTRNEAIKDRLVGEHKCALEASEPDPDERIEMGFANNLKKRREEISTMVDLYAELGKDIVRKRKFAAESDSTFKEHQEREAKITKIREDMAELRAGIRKKAGTGDEEFRNSINAYLAKVNEAAGIEEGSPL